MYILYILYYFINLFKCMIDDILNNMELYPISDSVGPLQHAYMACLIKIISVTVAFGVVCSPKSDVCTNEGAIRGL